MSVDLTTSHSGYAYCGQSWLTAVLPLPCVPCVGEVIGVCVCVSLVSRCSKENGGPLGIHCSHMLGSLDFSRELGNYCDTSPRCTTIHC